MDVLLILLIAWQMTKLIVEDGFHNARGLTPPRHQVRLAEIKAGLAPQRYGWRGAYEDLRDDALRAATATAGAAIADRAARKLQARKEKAGTTVPDPNAGPGVAVDGSDGTAKPKPETPPGPVADAAAADAKPVTRPAQRENTGEKYPPAPTAKQEDCREHTDPDEIEDPPEAEATVIPITRNTKSENTNQQEDTMTAPTTSSNGAANINGGGPTSEITGLVSAVNYANAVAAAHATHAGGEQYISSLRRFEVGDDDIAMVAAAQEASSIAAAKWKAAAAAIASSNTNVRQAYQGSPNAGNKTFALGE